MSENVLLAVIPLVVPIILAITKELVPMIPKVWIPVLAPILGAALDILGYYAGAVGWSPLWGAVLGGAGVALREIVDQVRKALPI